MVPTPDPWRLALPEELAFWRWWLTTDDLSVSSQRVVRLASRQMEWGLIEPVLASSGPVIRVLDVGGIADHA